MHVEGRGARFTGTEGLLVHLRGSFGSEVKKGALDLLHR